MKNGEFEDEDALNAKRLANKLDKAFSRYYEQEKSRLERKQKDLVALKARAQITDTNVPQLALDIVNKIHENMTKAYK